MIPKRIHYCWFGQGHQPALVQRCIKSWKEKMPDYELMLWNEENFDISSNSYTKEAYQLGKYAFVSDYVRLYALYMLGGVYMDTDVEMLRPLDFFLDLPAFSGFEDGKFIQTSLIGSEINGKWVEEQLNYYNQRNFINKDGKPDLTTNVKIISENMKKGGFIFDNTIRDYKGMMTVYPSEYFCPKSYDTGRIMITENTYCIHHFAESWIPRSKKMKRKVVDLVGERNFNLLKKFVLKK